MTLTDGRCPVCESAPKCQVALVDGYDYFECSSCGSLFIDPTAIQCIDGGEGLIAYSEDYWNRENPEAWSRAYGAALQRLSELMYYVRIPVRRFLDVGTGPGYFLDAVTAHLPVAAERFFGVEAFPPPSPYRTKCDRLVIGRTADIGFTVDAGQCMEVIEHLTPMMLHDWFRDLAAVSNPGALYVFNSRQPSNVMRECRQYLDPIGRGHIMSYSVAAVRMLAEPSGFVIHADARRDWVFFAEYGDLNSSRSFLERAALPLPENMSVLEDPEMGSVLRLLGMESVRSYAW